ncbi:MFS transporter [Akkermansiaceae bacterium]|nr:MFS transporter [Akkermansiaceae bacterium]
MMEEKPRLSFWQNWNMSFGFLGVQIGFMLQLVFMSTLFTKLGAKPSEIPILWLAAPLTGLLVQPIIGSMSDRTWNRLGRRRPYFLFGAIASAIVLFFIPDSPVIWCAVLGLWMMDTSFNVAMEPFRAFVGDKLPASQRTLGFVTQSFFIGLGGYIGGALPGWLTKMGVVGNAPNGLGLDVYYAFKVGALGLLVAILWTVFTTKEDPPADMEEFLNEKENSGPLFDIVPRWLITGFVVGALLGFLRSWLVDSNPSAIHSAVGGLIGAAIALVMSKAEVASALRDMPKTMKQLALVQFFTWLGLFCMWMMFGLATAQQVFGTSDSTSAAFDEGTTFGGSTMGLYSIVCFLVAFAIPFVAGIIGRRKMHALALILGGGSLLATGFVTDKLPWQLTMIGVGIAWASILSMPYAMLSTSIPPKRMGVYMGIFNFFIVIPEILAAVALEPIVHHIFGNDPVKVVQLGGASLAVAAVCCFFVGKEAEGLDEV